MTKFQTLRSWSEKGGREAAFFVALNDLLTISFKSMNPETTVPVAALSAEKPRRFQFTLVDMFWITGIAALLLAMSAKVDVTLVILASIFYPIAVAVGLAIKGRSIWRLPVTLLMLCFGFMVITPGHIRSRMASNETHAEATSRLIQQAQLNYIKRDWDNDGVFEYASNLKQLSDAGLIGETIARADATLNTPRPWNGYVFKVLRTEEVKILFGSSYNGRFVIYACPIEYDGTGRNSFFGREDGTLKLGDRGKDSLELFHGNIPVEADLPLVDW